MFSKACEYGIKATIYIAEKSKDGYRVSLKDIAHETNSPVAFTAKILQILAKNNIVNSLKGPTGGFEIDLNRMAQVTLDQIVAAIDGDKIYKGCGLGLSECSDTKPCPVHEKFAKVREELKSMLESTSIYELSESTKKGLTYLKI